MSGTRCHELLRRIDGLVLNYEESFQLTGKSNLVRAAEAILDLGPRFVVIKKGEHGAFLLNRSHDDEDVRTRCPRSPRGMWWTPPARAILSRAECWATSPPSAMRTTTGQPFTSFARALAYGTVVASFTIEAFSLERLTQISRDDIDTRLDRFSHMLHLGE